MRAFTWHAALLAITVTFTEINTVIPAMILQIGGAELHVGIVSAIMIGIPLVAQLTFASLLHGKKRKKPFLITAITLRIVALAAISLTIVLVGRFPVAGALTIIYLELLVFSAGGAFAGISYVDIIGKSISRPNLRIFFTRKQMISGFGILLSALIARQILRTFPYPVNYAILFASAALMLLAASGGFWMVKEHESPESRGTSLLRTIASIPTILRSDRQLRRYIVFNNLIGCTIALIPFYMAFAKRVYTLDANLAGNVLFIQIVGNIGSSLVWPSVVKRWGYHRILRMWSIVTVALPVAAALAGYFAPPGVFISLFFFVGVSTSARMVTQDVMIVELSTDENRVLYTGIVGTMNLTVVLLPILLGVLIRWAGYVPIFLGISLVAVLANVALSRLQQPSPGQ